jgi:hypothetical protein
MITLSVRGYRGIDSAELTCAPIALLLAKNAEGKSSVAQAAAAALTGAAIADAFEIGKKEVGEIIRRGARDAVCTVKADGGEARMSWPTCQLTTTGAEPPHASVYAAGIISMPLLSPKDRAAALEQYLHSAPTKDDLHAAMTEKFRDKSIDALWAEIETKEWDACARDYELERRDSSRDWARITGQSFGSDKSARWAPEGWSDHLDACTADELRARVDQARLALDEAIRSAATDKAEVDRLRKLADALPERQAALRIAFEEEGTARQLHDAAQADLTKHPAAAEHASLNCPHCGNSVSIEQGQLVKASAATVADPTARRRALAAEAQAAAILNQKHAEVAQARVGTTESEKAAVDLDAMNLPASGAPAVPHASEQRAREMLMTAELDARLKGQHTEAGTAYRRWLSANLKHEILIPAGLRAKKLGEVVNAYNEAVLAPLCTAAAWGSVNITEDLTFRLGERRYSLLSKGEQWRVRVLLQVAQAMHDGSSMVIIDNLEDLDSEALNGIFGLLRHAGLPAVVCVALRRDTRIPDLARAGLGQTYTIEKARTVALNQAAAA